MNFTCKKYFFCDSFVAQTFELKLLAVVLAVVEYGVLHDRVQLVDQIVLALLEHLHVEVVGLLYLGLDLHDTLLLLLLVAAEHERLLLLLLTPLDLQLVLQVVELQLQLS